MPAVVRSCRWSAVAVTVAVVRALAVPVARPGRSGRALRDRRHGSGAPGGVLGLLLVRIVLVRAVGLVVLRPRAHTPGRERAAPRVLAHAGTERLAEVAVEARGHVGGGW